MAGLKAIKLKIRSVEKTRKVTKAMEAVSAAKMRKAQHKALAGRAYARAAVSVLARVSGARELQNHPLARGANLLRGEGTTLYIVITSDKGLAGALNSAVLRAVWSDIRAHGEGSARVIAVGRKANDFFTTRQVPIEAYHPNTDQISSELIRELVDAAAQRFTLGEVDAVKIAYQNFISTFEQRPTIRTIFPLTLGELSQVVGDIVPARGAFAEATITEGTAPATYTIEPSAEEVLTSIVPRLASIFVYHALLETQASEHSARMVAMKSASDKAKELTHELTIDFNKARQASITREVSEITGGMEAMNLA
jgi:F-type H+-transporting ATPase subunit gamma